MTAGTKKRVIGRQGLGTPKDNGERLCEMCDMNELVKK